MSRKRLTKAEMRVTSQTDSKGNFFLGVSATASTNELMNSSTVPKRRRRLLLLPPPPQLQPQQLPARRRVVTLGWGPQA